MDRDLLRIKFKNEDNEEWFTDNGEVNLNYMHWLEDLILNSGSSETQAVRQNEKSQEVCLCDNPRTLECDDNKGPWCIKCEKYIYKQNE